MSPCSVPLYVVFAGYPRPTNPVRSRRNMPSSTFTTVLYEVNFATNRTTARPPNVVRTPFGTPSSPPSAPTPAGEGPFSSTGTAQQLMSSWLRLPPSVGVSPKRDGKGDYSVGSSATLPTQAVVVVFQNGSVRSAGMTVSMGPSVFEPLTHPLEGHSAAPSSAPNAMQLCASAFRPLLTVFGTGFSPVATGPVDPASILFYVSVVMEFVWLIICSLLVCLFAVACAVGFYSTVCGGGYCFYDGWVGFQP